MSYLTDDYSKVLKYLSSAGTYRTAGNPFIHLRYPKVLTKTKGYLGAQKDNFHFPTFTLISDYLLIKFLISAAL
jgi:hypothetical protein